MSTTAAPGPRSLARQGAVAAIGVGAGAQLVAVQLIPGSIEGDAPWDTLLGWARLAAWIALPCAVHVRLVVVFRLRRTRGATVQERCTSVALWSCAVPFVWAAGFGATVGAPFADPPVRAVVGFAVLAGGFAEMVWLITLTPVFIYHCTARALRGDPFNGAPRSRDGRDERDEDAEVGRGVEGVRRR